MGGERFGSYELLSLLGRGGMGEVYRAVDTRQDRGVVALKRLPAGLATDQDFQRRFLREAELAARLRDPHVIPIHTYGEVDGHPYLEMRLVDGVDLATDLDRHGPLPTTHAMAIVDQVAGALDAAHREGLVHRDVKPSNVLLNRPENAERPAVGAEFVYLIDFGIAANLLSSRRSSSVVSGTAGYMAPERFTGGGDHRVDVYALGCLLHEVLTGKPPYTGDFMELMWAHVNQPPPRPTQLRGDLPSGFDVVVATAMAKDPEHRYDRAESLAAAARQASSGQPPTPPRQSDIATASPHPPPRPALPGSPVPPHEPAGSAAAQPIQREDSYRPAPPTSTLAVFAVVLAFVIAPVGALLGIVARRRIRRTGEGGHGLATAALAVGSTLTVVVLIGGLVYRFTPPPMATGNQVQLQVSSPDLLATAHISVSGSTSSYDDVFLPYEENLTVQPGGYISVSINSDSEQFDCRLLRDGVILDQPSIAPSVTSSPKGKYLTICSYAEPGGGTG